MFEVNKEEIPVCQTDQTADFHSKELVSRHIFTRSFFSLSLSLYVNDHNHNHNSDDGDDDDDIICKFDFISHALTLYLQ